MEIRGCPKILCPECKAVLCKAVGKERKNDTKVSVVKGEQLSPQTLDGDYIIKCHKCGEYVAIKKDSGVVRIPLIKTGA